MHLSFEQLCGHIGCKNAMNGIQGKSGGEWGELTCSNQLKFPMDTVPFIRRALCLQEASHDMKLICVVIKNAWHSLLMQTFECTTTPISREANCTHACMNGGRNLRWGAFNLVYDMVSIRLHLFISQGSQFIIQIWAADYPAGTRDTFVQIMAMRNKSHADTAPIHRPATNTISEALFAVNLHPSVFMPAKNLLTHVWWITVHSHHGLWNRLWPLAFLV